MATKKRSTAKKKRDEYQETPGWGTAFQRVDNEPPQPQFTGQGVLDSGTLKEIREAKGEFQIAIWARDGDGKPLRNRDGSRRLRVHIQPPWKDDDDDLGADDDFDGDDDDDDDVPF